jgi:hypothetical protein
MSVSKLCKNVVHGLADLFLALAEALLQLAFQLLPVALGGFEFVIGQVAIGFPQMTFDFGPFSFDHILVHGGLLRLIATFFGVKNAGVFVAVAWRVIFETLEVSSGPCVGLARQRNNVLAARSFR